MGKVHISHIWRTPKTLVALMVFEFLGTIATLTLFGIADNDTYRTTLWRIGFENGHCSNPNQILYAYANHRALPSTPFIWSSVATQFNIICAVFSMFVLLVKLVMFIMHMWWPALSVIMNTVIVALWVVACAATGGSDHSDVRYPMPIAWYLAKGCEAAEASGNGGYCRQAQGAFAVALIMLLLFVANLALSIYSMCPTRIQRAQRKAELQEEARYMPSTITKGTSSEGLFHNALRRGDKHTKITPVSSIATIRDSSHQQQWEMQSVGMHHSGGFGDARDRQEYTPYTPRTAAFKTLDRQLPLRAEQERNARFG